MRFGIIGTNTITDGLLQAGGQTQGFQLRAVYSRTMQRAREYAAAHGAPLAFDDINALAACEEVEAVYIASPNSLHFGQALQMVNAGKHVLCEKPITTNGRQLAALLAAAAQKGVLVLEAMRPTLSPWLETLRAALAKIGPVRRAAFVYNQYSARYTRLKNGQMSNAFDPAYSGGALLDIGVYPVHMLVSLFGMPKSIRAAGVKVNTGVDGQGALLADYGHMVGEVSWSKITAAYTPSEIQGEKGSIILPHFSTATTMQLVLRDENDPAKTTTEEVTLDTAENNMVHELAVFMRLAGALAGAPAAGAKEVKKYHEWSQNAMDIMDEARRQMDVVYPADSISLI